MHTHTHHHPCFHVPRSTFHVPCSVLYHNNLLHNGYELMLEKTQRDFVHTVFSSSSFFFFFFGRTHFQWYPNWDCVTDLWIKFVSLKLLNFKCKNTNFVSLLFLLLLLFKIWVDPDMDWNRVLTFSPIPRYFVGYKILCVFYCFGHNEKLFIKIEMNGCLLMLHLVNIPRWYCSMNGEKKKNLKWSQGHRKDVWKWNG